LSLFVDTSAILAILNAADQKHARAGSTYRNLLETAEPLISTNYIILETVALLQSRLGISAVVTFQKDILPTLDVEWLTKESHEAAMTALLTASRRKLSLVDCTSFLTMRKRGLSRVFAFDAHFAEHGFEQI
jgi:uncharacterized protein